MLKFMNDSDNNNLDNPVIHLLKENKDEQIIINNNIFASIIGGG